MVVFAVISSRATFAFEGSLFCQMCCLWLFFFFQAEDGIRDKLVTGVQTCALPILVVFAAELLRIQLRACAGSGGRIAEPGRERDEYQHREGHYSPVPARCQRRWASVHRLTAERT